MPAQQGYISTNYTFVARDMALQGMNVVAQAVAAQGAEGEDAAESVQQPRRHASRSSRKCVRQGNAAVVGGGGQSANALHAQRGRSASRTSLTWWSPTRPQRTPCSHRPTTRSACADYAIGLHASSLVADGGTLQIGIGSLGDAIAPGPDRARPPRHRVPPDPGQSLCPDGSDGRELGRFDQGLYGCSEMFVNGFLQLIEAGIIRREVFADAALQQLLQRRPHRRRDGHARHAARAARRRAHALAAGAPRIWLPAALRRAAPGRALDGDRLVSRRSTAATTLRDDARLRYGVARAHAGHAADRRHLA